MSSSAHSQSIGEELPIPYLSPETSEALTESARRNGRTVHEEAEHIITTHLATSDEGED
jgi:hypothetical protein